MERVSIFRSLGACSAIALSTGLGPFASAYAQAVSAPQAADPAVPAAQPPLQPTEPFTGATRAAPAAAASSNSDEKGIAEIVVTAQRRAQAAQQVPISITAVTGEALVAKGVHDLTGLSQLAPSLNLSLQVGSLRTILRGVGGPAANGIDPSTAVFVDDVYLGGNSSLFHLDDVSRVEVLKGPQGTLFGRNATAGVIQVFTRDPTDDPYLTVKGGYESFDTVFGSVLAGGGLTDNLSMSVSLQGRKQSDGWTRNTFVNKDTQLGEGMTARAKLLWKPGPDTRIMLGGELSYSNYTYGMNDGLIKGTAALGSGGVVSPGGDDSQDSRLPVNKRPLGYVYLKVDHDFGPVELFSITAYRESKTTFRADLDAGPVPVLDGDITDKVKNFTQEVRLQSGQGSTLFGRDFTWVIGAFYLRGHERSDLKISGLGAAPFSAFGSTGRQTTDSISAFADATIRIFPHTDLSGGIRYNHDKLSVEALSTVFVGTTPMTFPTPNPDPRITFDEVSYRAVLSQHFTDDILGYISYSRGYKPGGYNLLSPVDAPVKPEILRSWEVGVKSTLFDRKLLLNVAAFHYNYTNLQVQAFGPNQLLLARNAAAARIKGLELSAEARPVRNLSINAGLSLLETKYTSFPNGPTYVPNPATCGAAPPYPPPVGGFTACEADLTGNRLVNAPKYQLTAGADYTLPLSNGATVDFSGNYSLTGQFDWYPDNNPLVRQLKVGLINGSITWTSPNEKWKVQGYVRNLTDKRYPGYVQQSTAVFFQSRAEPRVFGGFVQVSF